MANNETIPEREETMVTRAEAATDLLHQLMNGDDTTELVTEGGNMPTMRKWQRDTALNTAALNPGVFSSTAAGLAGTAEGKFFTVPSASDSDYLVLYQKSNGVAVEKGRSPSTKRVNVFESSVDLQLVFQTVANRIGAGAQLRGLVENADSSVDVYLSAGIIQLRNKNPANPVREITLAAATTINIPSGTVLLWRYSDDALIVLNNGSARPSDGYALLAYNNKGQIISGLLTTAIADLVKDTSEINLVATPPFRESMVQARVPDTSSVTIDLSATSLFAVARNGKQIATVASGAVPAVVLANNQQLVWDLVKNQVAVVGMNDRRSWPHIVLATCRNGATGGAMLEAGALLDKYVSGRVLGLTATERPFSHLTISGGAPKIIGNTLKLSATTFFAIGPTGTNVKELTPGVTGDFAFADNEVLIWDWDANALVKMSNNAARPKRFVVLLMYKNGTFVSGEMLPGLCALGSAKALCSHITFSRNGTADPAPTVYGSTVTMANNNMYAIGWDGKNVKSLTGISNSWTFADNEVLIWDWDANALVKMGNNDARPSRFVVLLHYKNSRWVDGEMVPLLLQQWANEYTLPDSIVDSAESRALVVPDRRADQGITVVGEQIWSFGGTSYPNNGVSNAPIDIYDRTTFEKLGTSYHNFGHAATVDYCAELDVMVIANGESTTSVLPRLDILLNASSYAPGAMLDWNNPVSTPRVSIEFFTLDQQGAVLKQIGGSGAVACFGEQPHILYMLTGQGGVRHRIFKVLLGMGANDFSDPTGVDLARWGVFTAGKADNEFNGTAKVLQTYTGLEYNVSQGLAFHEGKLYYGITSTANTIQVVEVQMLESGRFRTTKTFKHAPLNKDGSKAAIETEGVAILDGRYLLAGGRGAGNSQFWAIFPLYNEMGGTGVAGQRVTFPFRCNSVPRPMITPLSSVVDLFISAVDREGFTVSSNSGVAGPFNWTARIC